jgi:S1/P1 Nuclease
MSFVISPQLSIALAFTAYISGASAWGNLGHETVAYIAQNFVKSSTESYCRDILGDTSSSYLANVSTWADSYKYTSAGAFSYDYHFIDAHDDPPSTCNVDYSRDCGDSGCSVSAIQNYVFTLALL